MKSSAFFMSVAWSMSRTLENGHAFSLRPSAISALWKLRIRLSPRSMQPHNVSIAVDAS